MTGFLFIVDIIDDIRPKIENLIIITNEFSTFLADDLSDTEELNMDDDDVCQAVDSVGDKLEAAFFTMRDKISSVPKLQSKLDKMSQELQHMDSLMHQKEQQIVNLQQQISATQTKLDDKIRENAQLRESIRDNESWQRVSQNQEIPSQHSNRDSDSTEAQVQLEQLSQECLQLNVELESKSNQIQMLSSNIDSLNETVQNLRHERQQLCQEIREKSSECENMKLSHKEVCDELESLKQESSEQFQRMSEEYQRLQQTCRELQLKCDYLDEELQISVEQVQKSRAHHSDEQLEKEDNDFVVLQTRDCDEEDSLKRQCTHLKDENEKLIASMKTMSEKAIEYENERFTLQKYVNECNRLQDLVKRLSQELEATKKHLYQTSVESRETEDDKNDEIESLQEEMAKLEQQLSNVWNQLHEEKTRNHHLSEQLGSYEKANASISQQMQQQNAELEFLRQSNAERAQKLQSFEDSSNSGEVVALQEQNLQLQKMLDFAQQEHQATKNELEAAQTSLAQLRTVVSELEHLKSQNLDLQDEMSKLLQKYQSVADSFEETSDLLAKKDDELSTVTAEAKRSFRELHETQTALNEAQSDLKFAKNELETISKYLENTRMEANETLEQLKAAQNELQTVTERLHESEKSVQDMIEKYNHGVASYQKNIAILEHENAALRQQCETYRISYGNLQTYVSQIVSAASRTSDDAINIVHRLQSQWPSPKPVVDAEMQCSANLEADVRMEAETYELLLKDRGEELNALKSRYEEVKRELLQKDDECDAEISRYGNLVADLRNELSLAEERLASAQRALSQKSEDLQMLTQEFEHRLESSEAGYANQLQDCQYQIEQLEKKLHESRKPEVLEASVQVSPTQAPEMSQLFSDKQDSSFADVELDTNKEFFGTHDDRLKEDGSGLTEIEPGSEKEGPGLMKYFGYYKEKMKGLTEMLIPEEQTEDYSNWILPDQPIAKRQFIPEDASAPLVTEMVQHSAPPSPRLSVSDILDKLQKAIAAQMNDGGWDVEEDAEWICTQLQLNDSEFVNTAFKFVDLFDIVVQYYSSLPATDAVLEKFSSIANIIKPPSTTSNLPIAPELSETFVTKVVDTSKETIEQMVTLATLLENENKHLVDALIFFEETMASVRPPEDLHFQSVIEYWRSRVTIDDDVIDRVCEEYDIVPAKFLPGDQLVQWKEQMARCIEVILTPPPAPVLSAPVVVEAVCPIPVAENLQLLKKKVHKLICDLHYVYKDEETVNPADFFAQIEDLNCAIEATAKMALSKDILGEPAAIPSHRLPEEQHEYGHEDDHIEEEHDHHEHSSHHHSHDHSSHHHDHELPEHSESTQGPDQRDTVADLKSLLAESNKKIDSLVKDLMEVKSSREYNEVRQLHTKLDETLYQLHLRDVHVVELTRELTQVIIKSNLN